MTAKHLSVLFACTENKLRSPMAAALANHYFGHLLTAQSVGVHASDVDGFAVAVMAELGIDISGHEPRAFTDLDENEKFDLVISLSPEAQHSAVELTRYMECEIVYWPTFNPTAIEGNRDTILDAYREVRDGLLKRLQERFNQPAA